MISLLRLHIALVAVTSSYFTLLLAAKSTAEDLIAPYTLLCLALAVLSLSKEWQQRTGKSLSEFFKEWRHGRP